MGIPVDVRATGLGGEAVREHREGDGQWLVVSSGQVDAGLEMEMVGGRKARSCR